MGSPSLVSNDYAAPKIWDEGLGVWLKLKRYSYALMAKELSFFLFYV